MSLCLCFSSLFPIHDSTASFHQFFLTLHATRHPSTFFLLLDNNHDAIVAKYNANVKFSTLRPEIPTPTHSRTSHILHHITTVRTRRLEVHQRTIDRAALSLIHILILLRAPTALLYDSRTWLPRVCDMAL